MFYYHNYYQGKDVINNLFLDLTIYFNNHYYQPKDINNLDYTKKKFINLKFLVLITCFHFPISLLLKLVTVLWSILSNNHFNYYCFFTNFTRNYYFNYQFKTFFFIKWTKLCFIRNFINFKTFVIYFIRIYLNCLCVSVLWNLCLFVDFKVVLKYL